MTSPLVERERTQPDREAGFTLLELIVVLVIIGLTFTVFLMHGPMISHSLTTKQVAGELAAGLREARARAIGSDRPVSLTLDLKARRYRIADLPSHPIPTGFEIALLTTTGEVHKGQDPGIRFEPDGSSSGGRIELIEGKHKLDIGVDWLTGRIRVVNVS
jgi:general secretion pathway protein H